MEVPQWLYNPVDDIGIVRFYLVWVSLVFIGHVTVDWHSSRTPDRAFFDLSSKIVELVSSGSTVSSIHILIIMGTEFTRHPLFSGGLIALPIVLSSLSGVIMGLSGLKLKTFVADQ